MAQTLRVLVGCETSGRVRRAFAARGHDAWSCDLLPAEDGSNRHLVGDIRELLHMGWDLLAVMHPPCTRLCNSGVRWLHEPPRHAPKEATAEDRAAWPDLGRAARLAVMWRLLEEGRVALLRLLGSADRARGDREPGDAPPCPERMPAGRPRPQIVQPWWFGEPFFKATGFYRRGLPPLAPTNRLTPPKSGTEEHKVWSAIHRASPGPDRWKIRSRTFAGVAEAIAEQWGGHAEREAAA